MNPKLQTVLTTILGALILLFAAYINGYPIVYSDTSTYLASGFELETPFDRPITYGLFLRLGSLNGFSIWGAIFLQNWILAYLIFKLFEAFLKNKKHLLLGFFISVVSLATLTSASWTSSQIIPDIFTAVVVLSLILLCVSPNKKYTQFFFYFLFLLGTTMHMSHITVNIIFILNILIIRQFKFLGLKKIIQVRPLLICVVLTLTSILTTGSALSKSKHGFLMGALVEHGIAKTYLDEFCPTKNYKFCAYKDSLPEKAWKFLWEKDSPFYKMGAWKGTKDEFNEIIAHTLTSPKYLMIHVQESLKATVDQLTKFDIGDGNGVFIEGTLLYERVKKYVPNDISAYKASLQAQNKLAYLNSYNNILLYVILLSCLGLIFVLIKIGKDHKMLLAVILITILAILVNAWACGTLANAIDRLGAKIIWMLPLVVMLASLKLWEIKKSQKSTK